MCKVCVKNFSIGTYLYTCSIPVRWIGSVATSAIMTVLLKSNIQHAGTLGALRTHSNQFSLSQVAATVSMTHEYGES